MSQPTWRSAFASDDVSPRLAITRLQFYLLCCLLISLALSHSIAHAQSLNQVCQEDGGLEECTSPQFAATYYLIRSPFALGFVATEDDLYNTIRNYDGGYCSNTTDPPPYTWTRSGSNFPFIEWDSTIREDLVTGHCDGGPLTAQTAFWSVSKFLPESCPVGWITYSAATSDYPYGHCFRDAVPPCPTGQCVGDPIDPANGDERESEVDYPGSPSDHLEFVRNYSYMRTVFGPGQTNGSAGQGWSHSYERRLWFLAGGTIRAVRQDGSQRTFFNNSGSYQEYGNAVDTLTPLPGGGWLFSDDQDTQETYDATGTLQSIRFRGGRILSLSYSTATTPAAAAPFTGLLLSVADEFGHQLSFTYNAQGLIATMTDPAGGVYQYAYNAGLLASVTYPDSTTKQYLYNESSQTSGINLPYALTGIIDESSTRYATIGYDSAGHAISSQLAGGVNAFVLSGFNYLAGYGYGTTVVKDPLGTTRSYNYVLAGGGERYADIFQPCPRCGNATRHVGYDANGNVATKLDWNNYQTNYGYDLTRNLETFRTDAVGTPRARTISTQWDPNWRQPSIITEFNRITAYAYDAFGNVLSKVVTDTSTIPNTSRVWTYTYDSYGRVLTVDGPRTDVSDMTTYTYYTCNTGAGCGHVHTVTNAAGQMTTYNTYNLAGQPLTITDANGVVTTFTYDARQRLTSSQVGGETTSLEYWSTGLLKKVTLPDRSYLLYSYDPAHRLTQVSDGPGNSIDYILDAMGNRTAENAYDSSNTLHRTHSRVFDAMGQLYQDVDAAGTVAGTTTFSYDGEGNQTSIAAPLGRTTANAYDELNRVKQITDPANGITKFSYDANDNLTSVVDPRNLTTGYTYNGFGDLIGQTSPDTGTTTNTYDSAGNLITSTDARGAVATYGYDALNRVTSVAYSLGGSADQTIRFTYDAGPNGQGHLTGASDVSHSLNWSYDALGRVTGKSQTVAGVSLPVGYTYTQGNVTSLTTPSGQTLSYGYNANHQVISVAVNGTTVLKNVTYEPLGPVNGWTWGNGSTTARTYDMDGKITQIASAGTKIYSYDNASRIIGIADSTAGSSNWTYGYDALDRITSGTNSAVTRGWTYDANGNRLTETGSAPSSYTIAPTSNRITSISGSLARSYSYDAAGNAIRYASATVTYNNAGRLQTLTQGGSTETFVYNALGERIEKTGGSAGTVLYGYDEAGRLLGEYDGAGHLIQETVWLGDIPIATLRPSGSGVSIYYVHSDQLDTPRQVTRPSDNAQMWTWSSDPFGTDAANENPAGLGVFTYNLRFPGQYYDQEMGLNYNYFRDYDPPTGRFVQSDPIGLDGGLNTYMYGDERPTMTVDPRGLFSLNVEAFWHRTPNDAANPGLTLGHIPSDAIHCSCQQCGSTWTLTECSALLLIETMVSTDLGPNGALYVSKQEQNHVDDLKNGAASVREAGAAVERSVKGMHFSSEAACIATADNAVTFAIRAARSGVEFESRDEWDRSGLHRVPKFFRYF